MDEEQIRSKTDITGPEVDELCEYLNVDEEAMLKDTVGGNPVRRADVVNMVRKLVRHRKMLSEDA
jgi:hypothetical protein